MRRSKPQPIRNKLDLTDPIQVRLIRKRLRLSDTELTAIVGRIGNSLSAISKEVALQRTSALPAPTEMPPAVVIASTTGGEQTATEAEAAAPAS